MRALSLTVAFAATVPLANWMIENVGSCSPHSPCVIPVGFGQYAPSGVLVVGAAIVLRDFVQEVGGVKASLLAIVIGAALSWMFAPAALVTASVTSFAVAELCNLAIYTPLRKKGMPIAVVVSGLVGSYVDSALFLLIAFGSLDYVLGQTMGKYWVVAAASITLVVLRSRRTALAQGGGE
ncbi:VUT family protein [Pseudochrobactrum lubricantis]|uniref:VUT family protein n=1 Tax=Pseudochrobactrum lubricantis TaxID=558172 RepID=UPI0035D82EF4